MVNWERGLIVRIIPASAEKEPGAPCGCHRPSGHPRTRGERSMGTAAPTLGFGSSPHTRRNGKRSRAGPKRRRGIPAQAEKGPRTIRWASLRQGHPRPGGEMCFVMPCLVLNYESPPRRRRKSESPNDHDPLGRVISAHAEKGPRPRRCRRTGPGHPRSRGERRWPNDRVTAVPGSSPRAEKGCATRSRRSRRSDHPRSRGERVRITGHRHCRTGSSPLTRRKG